jgi:hypothetical protein
VHGDPERYLAALVDQRHPPLGHDGPLRPARRRVQVPMQAEFALTPPAARRYFSARR